MDLMVHLHDRGELSVTVASLGVGATPSPQAPITDAVLKGPCDTCNDILHLAHCYTGGGLNRTVLAVYVKVLDDC